MSNKIPIFLLATVAALASACSTAGPFVSGLSSDGANGLNIEKCYVHLNAFTGIISNENCTSSTIHVRGSSANVAADSKWEAVQSGFVKDQYAFLLKSESSAAEAAIQSLTERQADALTNYILQEKGRVYELSKNFKISPELDDNERAFIRWYLSKYSGYTPK
ncbi:MAG: hypothetical protein A2516_01225 [Alphaproteobacteria bacterium RIFOXYD12_FULL_60_8]|nr:MAG: hypothetical protein A2516_01225 [Alphaproteobacteria bacterium RIFOXYD12_FULL_60_8]